jgi:16S rRNA (guanine966-N2)-methyltransferase
VRVIAGSLGGRRLLAPSGAATRPTADRVREALFAILGDLSGVLVLDLFAGAGTLGIEALSRGAERAVFVERGPAAAHALRSNLAALGLGADRAEVRLLDVRAALRVARSRRESYDLVLIDPPYRLAAAWTPQLASALPSLLAPGGRVVTESDHRAPLELGFELETQRRYGDTLIRIEANP